MATPNTTKAEFLKGNIDVENDVLKIALISSNTAYTFDVDAHDFVDDIFVGGTAEEFGDNGGTGYSRQTLANVAVTVDDTDDEGVFDADDVTFSGLDGETIQGIVIYKQVGGNDTTPGDDPVIVVYDDDSAGSLADLPLTTNGGDVTISFDTEGIININ